MKVILTRKIRTVLREKFRLRPRPRTDGCVAGITLRQEGVLCNFH